MINTGLTEQEKESLLKWFLVKTQIMKGARENEYYIYFGNKETGVCTSTFEKPIADMIIKAMDNLRGIK